MSPNHNFFIGQWFTPFKIGHSLPARAWTVIILISLVVLSSSIASIHLSKVSEADAKAINQAGSLRMATYRINHQLSQFQLRQTNGNDKNSEFVEPLIDDMQKRFMELKSYQNKINNSDEKIDKILLILETQWNGQLLPLLKDKNSDKFYQHSLEFLHEVNELVTAIQNRNEMRQIRQQRISFISLFFIVVIMIFGMRELHYNTLIPLKRLTIAARNFKEGKRFDIQNIQNNTQGYQALNELSEACFQMLNVINNHQNHLENEVKQKTHHLTQSNQALYALYDFAQKIATEHLNTQELHKLIKDFVKLLPNSEISLCIHGENYESNTIISLSDRSHYEFCMADDCESCNLKSNIKTRVIPIQSQNSKWGELLIKEADISTKNTEYSINNNSNNNSTNIPLINIDNDHSLSKDDLLITLANLIALAFASEQRQKQRQELILSEERNTFARELHDSIAQSLSYLKIQASMLKTLNDNEKVFLSTYFDKDNLDKNSLTLDLQAKTEFYQIHAKQDKVLEDLKEGLNHAYSQLRELLNTFRIKINGGDFHELMQQAITEFSQKGHFTSNFDNQVLTLNLSAAEQVDLLQITREALSNVYKHAKASHANVVLYQDAISYDVVLLIQDNGVGISQSDKNKYGHYGLSTMAERAASLGGSIDTRSVKPHGTEVMVRFLPQFFLKHTKAVRPLPTLNDWSREEIESITKQLDNELTKTFGKTSA